MNTNTLLYLYKNANLLVILYCRNSGHCPIDNINLSMKVDIFPDNYTKREIQEQRMSCPFSAKGNNDESSLYLTILIIFYNSHKIYPFAVSKHIQIENPSLTEVYKNGQIAPLLNI